MAALALDGCRDGVDRGARARPGDPLELELQRHSVGGNSLHPVVSRSLDRFAAERDRPREIPRRCAGCEQPRVLVTRSRDPERHHALDLDRAIEMSGGIVIPPERLREETEVSRHRP